MKHLILCLGLLLAACHSTGTEVVSSAPADSCSCSDERAPGAAEADSCCSATSSCCDAAACACSCCGGDGGEANCDAAKDHGCCGTHAVCCATDACDCSCCGGDSEEGCRQSH